MKLIFIIPFVIYAIFGMNSSLPDSTSQTTNEIRLYSDVTIDSTEIINYNIRILGGKLDVHGTVKNQITVIGGDVQIFPSAIIEGKIVAIGGNVITDKGATISGKVVEASMDQGLIYRETFSDTTFKSKDKSLNISEFSDMHRQDWFHPRSEILVFNRNEGLLFYPLNWNWDQGNKSLIHLSFSLGYRFSKNEFVGKMKLETSQLMNRSVTIYLSGFKEARTDDEYRLPLKENTWANILGRQDFYDRWDETGLRMGIGLDLSSIKLKGEFVRATQSEIPVDDNVWSLFNDNRQLRLNPIMKPTDVEYFAGLAAFRTRSFQPLSTGFAFLSKIYLVVKENDITLSNPTMRLSAITIGNMKLMTGLILRNRLILGSASYTLSEFRKFGVGGLGSVSAFDYKYQTGNHMGQYNSEIIFTDEFTKKWFFVKFFYDAGMAYHSDKLMDMGYILNHRGDLLQSTGIGFGKGNSEELNFGFNFAKKLQGNHPIETTVRINYSF